MKNKNKCFSVVRTSRGKWTYYAVKRYIAGYMKDGKPVWKSHDVEAMVTTPGKAWKLCESWAAVENCYSLPHVRHNMVREVSE